MAKTVEQDFSASVSRVFRACRQAVAQLGYVVIASDESGKMISFNTGRSRKSWAGQDLQATVLGSGTTSRLVIGGTIARRGGLSSEQQVAWGEKAALSKKFLAEVTSILPTIPEGSSERVTTASPRIADSRLEALAKAVELKEKGILSDEEFQAEKVRILGS